jgi:4a-hydroxytetrahydrobiopterin dehydratase
MARLSDAEVSDRLKGALGWSLDGPAIKKAYKFPDFGKAMTFVRRVADLAEAADHHPDILIQYDTVTLTLTSHDSGGLTARDFRLAGQIEKI